MNCLTKFYVVFQKFVNKHFNDGQRKFSLEKTGTNEITDNHKVRT